MPTRRELGRYLGGLGGLALGLGPAKAWAHPYHATLTQALHNRKEGTLECSMKVDPDALQAALRRAGSPKLNIDAAEASMGPMARSDERAFSTLVLPRRCTSTNGRWSWSKTERVRMFAYRAIVRVETPSSAASALTLGVANDVPQ